MKKENKKDDYSITLESPEEFERQSRWWAGAENMDVIESIAQRISQCCSLMDVGAGTGAAIPVWLKRSRCVIAVDNCTRAVQHIRTHFAQPEVLVIASDIRALVGPIVDVVVCKATLKHFGPQWRDILRRLFDLARQRVIFTMGVSCKAEDRNPDAPYYDWAEPMEAVIGAIPNGWDLRECFGNEKEPVFVCDKEARR